MIGARGLKTSLDEKGWAANYTYGEPGTYKLTAVATNHGYDGPDWVRTVEELGDIIVK